MAESIRSVVVTIKVDTNKQTHEECLVCGEDETLEQFEAARRRDVHALDGAVVTAKSALPDLPCPHCGHADTRPLRNYGRPIVGETPDSSRWQCLECKRQFDGPEICR